VAGIRWWNARQGPAEGRTHPTLEGTGASGSTYEMASAGSLETLLIRLSQGQALPVSAELVPMAIGQPLTAAEIERILARLPDLATEPGDQTDLNLPTESLPAPRPGQTIQESFPPPAAPVTPVPVDTGPLEVLRYSPEGAIPLAPFVNVTFNQPMVALATLETLAARDVPVRLDPPLPGTWKWLGTKTLSFEYDSAAIDRLPMATEYVVTIPAGTTSATGGVLAQEVRWSFSTPPPKMLYRYPPDEPQPLDPIFVVAFDQRIDPQAVLNTIEVTAGGQPVPLRLVGDQELQADAAAARQVSSAGESRWLAFRAQEPLPADSTIRVRIGPGTPSAEGPLVTQDAQSYGFATYAPLRIVRHGCAWYNQECAPMTPFYIEFNNPIDADAYQESMLRVEPPIVGATVNVVGNTINIRGMTVGRTDYRVVVDGAIGDLFGQTLGSDTQLTFKVGSAEPVLYGPEGTLVTLDPASRKPLLSVYSINFNRLRVRAYQVEPTDWASYREYLRNYYQQTQPKLPGRLVMDETIPVESPADVLVETQIDLSQPLDGKTGHLVVLVEPTGLETLLRDRGRWMVQTWIQVTQIGLDAFSDHSEMVVWTTDLQDGRPLGGTPVENLVCSGQTCSNSALATTGEDGTVRFPMPDADTFALVARQGSDSAILPKSSYFWGDDVWRAWPVQDELRWYVFDDRAMYRPGEEVHVKGWMRRIGGGQYGDVGLVGSGAQSVRYQMFDPQGNELLSGETAVNVLGGFDLSFTVPENSNLGYAQVTLVAQGQVGGLAGNWYGHSFQVQEFRRPEFEVTAYEETTGPHFVGDHAVLAVKASYYAGGSLPNAEVTWRVNSSPSSYSPPNWPDFTFGRWVPWWQYGGYYAEVKGYRSYDVPGQQGTTETFAGLTDAAGIHYLRLDFDPVEAMQPFSVIAESEVMDVNRQAWSAATTLLVHPADLYVGLRGERTFVQRGEPLEVWIIVTDLDGNAVTDRPVEVRAARMEWKYRQGSWRQEEVDVQTCSVQSASEPVLCSFQTEIGGTYQISAVVTDDSGRQNQSQLTRWVSGGQRPPARKVELETVTLIPEKETYQPGDVAQILVQAPFSPAEGLLTVNRSGLLTTQRFSVLDGTATLQIPIEEGHVPNLNVQVDLVGAAARADDRGEPMEDVPPRPAYASGQLNLSVPPLARTLSLQVAPQATELEPGGETTLDVWLTDAQGQPVPDAELAVVVVDEAILALTQYQLADPLGAFYWQRGSDLTSVYGRSSIVLANPEALTTRAGDVVVELITVEKQMEVARESSALMPTATAAPTAMPMAMDAAQQQPIALRTDFNPLATFAPSVRTGADGRAQVPIKVPDNLTRYRVMVVAVSGGKHFGSGEANLVARLPLMVRPSAPRFLNFGDSFELPVVVQNQTDQPLAVEVVMRVSNLELTGSIGQRVNVPPKDRVEVRFAAQTSMVGTARFQVAAVAGAFSDAASGELPVYTPATTEAFATYGVVDEGAVSQPVAAPVGVFAQFGGLEISTSSTALQALSDAVLYLVSYPFDCTEQRASRILAVAALRDVLAAFSAAGLPSTEDMEAAVRKDIDRLQALQNNDGGYPYWERGKDSIPYNTVHVAHALQRAEMMGFQVPAETRSQVLAYLGRIENHYPHWYDKQTRWTVSAYALYVRDLMGDGDPTKARQLLAESGLEQISLEAVAWLWQVLIDDPASQAELTGIRRLVNNRAVETAGAANFTTSYGDQAYLLLHSDRRTDALLLDALIADDPTHDLIPKLVNGLMAHRTQGRWNSTQENVFVLLALDSYFDTFEAQPPEFVARIWLGDTYVGSHAYAGRTTERRETVVPMNYLVSGPEEQDLILSKEGPGRLYYRLGLRYAPTDLELDPLDMGFVVQRIYEAVDDPEDVRLDSDGVWHIRAGARVRVRLTMVADNRRYHVALADPLPAGLEIVNPALAVSGSTPQDPTASDYRYGWWWWGTWYEHQNMRDQRAEAFTTLLWEGVYHYSYVARATTPGRFVVPPAKAEEMYSPEVFGRSGSDWVVVR